MTALRSRASGVYLTGWLPALPASVVSVVTGPWKSGVHRELPLHSKSGTSKLPPAALGGRGSAMSGSPLPPPPSVESHSNAGTKAPEQGRGGKHQHPERQQRLPRLLLLGGLPWQMTKMLSVPKAGAP